MQLFLKKNEQIDYLIIMIVDLWVKENAQYAKLLYKNIRYNS